MFILLIISEPGRGGEERPRGSWEGWASAGSFPQMPGHRVSHMHCSAFPQRLVQAQLRHHLLHGQSGPAEGLEQAYTAAEDQLGGAHTPPPRCTQFPQEAVVTGARCVRALKACKRPEPRAFLTGALG